MKKLSQKGRRVFRRVCSGLGAVAFSFLLPVCASVNGGTSFDDAASFDGAVYGPPTWFDEAELEEADAE